MTRSVWTRGTGLLLALLLDDLAIAKAIRARRWDDLLAAAEVARAGVSPRMAASDPAQYRALRDAITLFFLKGYRCLDRRTLETLISGARRTA